jgi:hypothetical protein
MHPKRVHIVPVQFEFDRVVDPLVEHGADVVYLLYDAHHDRRPEYYDDIEATLETHGLVREETLFTIPCTHDDPYAVFGLVTTLAAEHSDDSVAVNVATGSKLAAIGAAMGCLDADTNARAYFAHAESHAYDGYTEPAARGYDGETHLIDYPIESPARQQVAMMAVIATETTGTAQVKKRTLIDRGLWVNRHVDEPLDFVTRIERAGSDSPAGRPESFDDLGSNAKKGAYAALRTHVLDPLLARGYIDITSPGRSDSLRLTDTGEKTLQAFRHKVTDVVRILDEESRSVRNRTNYEVPSWLREGLDGEP